jgi:hypothetical protein
MLVALSAKNKMCFIDVLFLKFQCLRVITMHGFIVMIW